jgi:PadR family transcriptional regulator PadR
MKNAVGSRGSASDDDGRAETTHGKADAGLPPRGTPKNYLMAWLLVMLKDLNLHGYEIMKALKENFAVVSDPGTVYRALRQLERDGYITSWWDPKEQGPARRIYTLTETGSDALKMWTAALEQYRTNLDAFFSLYTGTWTKDHAKKPEE